MMPSPPTGISVETYNNRIIMKWVKNPESDVKGYNVYNSTTSGGGISGYVKINNTLVESYTEVKKEILETQHVTEESGNTRTTTTKEVFREVFIFSFTHSNLTEKKRQFYVITAVNNTGEESVYSIEIDSTPLSVPSEIVDVPIRSQNDISLDYLTELLARNKDLDVKPGSEIRQLHVDPNSREMHWAFVREDFAMRAQSFLTLRDLDDADNDGISDEVADSEYKQTLKQAYFFTDDLQVQELIDDAFQAIAANYGKNRLSATKASTTVVFYSSTSPTTDVLVSLGEEISTIPTETEAAIKFQTLSSATMYVSEIENYYNPITQRYEIQVNVEAVEPGSIGNVNSNTIINTNIAGLSVTNPNATFGGRDEETNADLADRAELAFLGLDVGTVYGYMKTCREIPNVRDVMVIDAGHALMQRDYDDIRKKHVFGKVDIYIRGGENSQTEEKVGFLFKQVLNETFQVIDPSDFIIRCQNLNVTPSTPIYNVVSIRNISKGRDYDLLGNWIVSRNGITQEKRTQTSLNIQTGEITFIDPLDVGDVIMADYQYKITVSNEALYDPASGGELTPTLHQIYGSRYVVKNSYSFIKNDVELVEQVDYILNITNGQATLAVAMVAGDVLIANYQYVVYVSNESVISSAAGGETNAFLQNANVMDSFFIDNDGISIDLEEHNTINQSINMIMSSNIIATYRYRDSDPILLQVQPANRIISVVGSISGTLEKETNYILNKVDDILLEGNSSKANRTLKITYENGIPTGNLVSSSELITLVNNEYKELSKYGIDPESIIVRRGSTVYLKNSDYLVLSELDGKRVRLARSRNSSIVNGAQLTVYYNYGEILTITYEANQLVKIVQDQIDVSRHITADVLVKQVLETFVDLDISVVLDSDVEELKVISDIRTAVSNAFNKLKVGKSISQSYVISAIEVVSGVASVVVPLTKMVKAKGTQIVREIIASTFEEYQANVVKSYSTGPGALLNKTSGHLAKDGFYAIFEDDRPLILVSSPNDVDSATGQGYIGDDGEIIISTIESDPPALHQYTVSYVVSVETGSKDLSASSLEFLSLGDLILTTA